MRRPPAEVLEKDQWQEDADAQVCGCVHIEDPDGWAKGAHGTRAHGAQRQALAAGPSEGPAHLRPPGGDSIQVQMQLTDANMCVLKVRKFKQGKFVTVTAGAEGGDPVKFIGYGMPAGLLAAYKPQGNGNVLLDEVED